MRVKLHPLYMVLGVVYTVLGQGVTFLCSLFAVTVHEFAHMFSARRVGVRCGDVTLYPYGGQIITDNLNLSCGDEVRILLAGPLVNLIMASIILALWWLFPVIYPYTEALYAANLANGIINLVIAYPLDGGRVLLALLKKCLRKRTAIRAATVIGYVFTAVITAVGIVCVFHKNFTPLIFAIFLFTNQFELKSAGFTSAFLNGRKREITQRSGLKIVDVLVGADTPVYRLLAMSNHDGYYYFHIADDAFNELSVISENELYRLAQENDIYISIGSIV